MYEKIMLPTDGSDVAATATDTAIYLAGRFDAQLWVVHVREPGELGPDVEDPQADEFANRGREATEEAAERARAAGIEVTAALLKPTKSVHKTLVTAATEKDVDCIVMGTHGRSGLDRLLLGSVAERILRTAPVPVVTVGEERGLDAPERILVPTDGSESAGLALDHARKLTAATDAAIHVLHVVDPRGLQREVDTGLQLDSLEEAGEQLVDEAAERAKGGGVSTVEAHLRTGTPHRTIVDYADEYDVDCIVMGSHGRTGLERYILGSVTERVRRLTDRPMIVMKSDER